MSVGVVDKSTGERIQTAGDPLDKVGNLANLTTSAKANAVEAINEVNAGKANQAQLATVEASTTASKPYSAGEYLVLGGVLYKVTANIAQGGTIVTEGAGKNVDLATVGGELATLKSSLTNLIINQITEVTFDENGRGTFTIPEGYNPLIASLDEAWVSTVHYNNGHFYVTAHSTVDPTVLIESTTVTYYWFLFFGEPTN